MDEEKSKEEVEASIKKLEAEATQALAEAKKSEAEARKILAEATKAELEAQKAYRNRQRELSTDEENHLYRFSKDVSHHSVQACMSKLTEWHRKDPKCAIEIVFSSPGGSIVDGFELFDFIQHLRARGHTISTGSLGMAASMAGILLQAGNNG